MLCEAGRISWTDLGCCWWPASALALPVVYSHWSVFILLLTGIIKLILQLMWRLCRADRISWPELKRCLWPASASTLLTEVFTLKPVLTDWNKIIYANGTVYKVVPSGQDQLTGLGAVLVACFSSGFAGVFYEKLLKSGAQPSIVIRLVIAEYRPLVKWRVQLT